MNAGLHYSVNVFFRTQVGGSGLSIQTLTDNHRLAFAPPPVQNILVVTAKALASLRWCSSSLLCMSGPRCCFLD